MNRKNKFTKKEVAVDYIWKQIGFSALIIFLFLETPGIRGDVIAIYSSPEFDGEIAYHPWVGLYTSTTWWETTSGDWWNWGDMVEQYARSYFSFDISVIDSGSSINSAELHIYQSLSVGDGQEDVFPQWTGVPGGETLFCIADHIDYGTALDTMDWTAGDHGDPQTIETNIGLVSNNAGLGYKVLSGLGYCVQEDLNTARGRTQFRVRFPIDTDDDKDSDFLDFFPGDSDSLKPYLEVDFTPASVEHSISERNTSDENLITIHPNPAGGEISIRYTLRFSIYVRVSIYNVGGRCIETLLDSFQKKGAHTLSWDGRNDNILLPAGIYFVHIDTRLWKSTKMFVLINP